MTPDPGNPPRTTDDKGRLMTPQPSADKAGITFNHHSAEYADRWVEINDDLRQRCPVAWTPEHGGFWVITGYDELAKVARDDATFSSAHDLDATAGGYGGITIPPPHVRAIPIELDPPEFLAYRRLLNPPFAPAAMD